MACCATLRLLVSRPLNTTKTRVNIQIRPRNKQKSQTETRKRAESNQADTLTCLSVTVLTLRQTGNELYLHSAPLGANGCFAPTSPVASTGQGVRSRWYRTSPRSPSQQLRHTGLITCRRTTSWISVRGGVCRGRMSDSPEPEHRSECTHTHTHS